MERVKVYRIDYKTRSGEHRRKYVHALDSYEAMRRARLTKVVDICTIPEDSKELEGVRII